MNTSNLALSRAEGSDEPDHSADMLQARRPAPWLRLLRRRARAAMAVKRAVVPD